MLTFSWQASAPSTSLTGYVQRDCLSCDLCSGDCISKHDVRSAGRSPESYVGEAVSSLGFCRRGAVPNEGLDEAIAQMGRKLGTLYWALWQEVVFLHIKWAECNELFIPPPTGLIY
jgi:hypothetical protein